MAWSRDVINCAKCYRNTVKEVSRCWVVVFKLIETCTPKFARLEILESEPECGGSGTAARGGGSWRCPASSRCTRALRVMRRMGEKLRMDG
jgi:hypothetical protein